jgi:hypothetical protein
MDDPNVVKRSVVDRYRAIAAEYVQLNDQIAKAEERKRVLEQIANDCVAAGRLFGFDAVTEAAAAPSSGQSSFAEISHSPAPAPIPAPIPAKAISIKGFAVSAAEKAYPEAVRASQIRQELETHGVHVHEKTVGMTLYRLLKRGFLKRRGIEWFFIPVDQRTSSQAGDEAEPSP